MPSVTITGTGSSSLVLNYDSNTNYALAAQLASQINAGVAANPATYVTTGVPGFGQNPPPLLAGQTGVYFQTTGDYANLTSAYSEVAAKNGGTAVVTTNTPVSGQVILSDSGTNLDFTETGGSGTVAAGGGNNTLYLYGAGNWLINAGTGNNGIVLGSGNDLIQSIGNDSITAGTGAETVNAQYAKSDFVQGLRSDLYFIGGSGGATILGGFGSDTFIGGSGTQIVHGGLAGDNLLEAGAGAAATLIGGGGGDTLLAAGSANQVLTAGSGAEYLSGGISSGNNLLTAGSGNDTLVGGFGADTFVGGTGHATVLSGGTSDVYEFIKNQSGGTNLITDILDPTAIKIDLHGYGANEVNHALNSQTVSNGSVTISLTDGTSITFQDVTQLTANNFKTL